MTASPNTWTLWKEETLLGEIVTDDVDQPWLHGRWRPTRAFDEVAPLFARDLAIINDDSVTGLDELWNEIWEMGIQLHEPNGERVAEFLLHIDGERARFRY